jgi:hypothetical protein
MHDKLDQAREQILDRIIQWSSLGLDSNAPSHVRNLAAVFDILTNKKLDELRVMPYTDATGTVQFIDAYGQAVSR